MAVDPSIHLFSYELFDHLWSSLGETNRATLQLAPESLKVESHVTRDIVDAVCCRQVIFQEIYTLQYEYTKIVLCNSPSDFLSHLCVAFSDESFTELKVFDRLIATCAFTIGMSIHCQIRGNKLFLKDDFLCWAMYFDTELKSTFYEQGGWKVLKRVAKSYVLPFLALQTLNTSPFLISGDIDRFMIAVDDFCHFQTFQDQGNQTCAKSWVDFRIRNVKNTKRYKVRDLKSVEEFLTRFKYLCDPLGERVLEDCFRTHNESILLEFKGNDYLEKLSRKLSNFHLTYPTKQNYSFQDGLLINATPEMCKGKTDPEKALSAQASGMNPVCNDKCVDSSLTTKLSTFQNLNDSQVSKRDGSNVLSEEEFKELWRKYTETNDEDDVQIDQEAFVNFFSQKAPMATVDLDSLMEAIEHEQNTSLKDGKLVNQNLEEDKDWFQKLLPKYESMKRSMKVKCIHAMLSHASVFMADHETIHTENEFASNLTSQAKAIGDGQNATKKKKKKKRSGKSASSLEHENDTDDTKDILRMVLVLGCQPALNYVRSTIKQD